MQYAKYYQKWKVGKRLGKEFISTKKKSINCPWGFTLYILRYASGSFFCYSTKEQSSDGDRRSREAGKLGGAVPQLQWH